MKSKYNARKIEIDGIKFDSKKEARRYSILLQQQQEGTISDLQRQVPFELIPKQTDPHTGKVLERACTYRADFVYKKDGETIVEDVKSAITGKEPLFVVKRKLMLFVHGIKIQEV